MFPKYKLTVLKAGFITDRIAEGYRCGSRDPMQFDRAECQNQLAYWYEVDNGHTDRGNLAIVEYYLCAEHAKVVFKHNPEVVEQ